MPSCSKVYMKACNVRTPDYLYNKVDQGPADNESRIDADISTPYNHESSGLGCLSTLSCSHMFLTQASVCKTSRHIVRFLICCYGCRSPKDGLWINVSVVQHKPSYMHNHNRASKQNMLKQSCTFGLLNSIDRKQLFKGRKFQHLELLFFLHHFQILSFPWTVVGCALVHFHLICIAF